MIKCRIHIKNEGGYMDTDVFVEIKLSCLPPIGSILWLTEQERKKLQKMATKNLDIAKRYAPEWFYMKSYNCENPQKENLKDLSFDDASTVTDILFSRNRKVVDIEISSAS